VLGEFYIHTNIERFLSSLACTYQFGFVQGLFRSSTDALLSEYMTFVTIDAVAFAIVTVTVIVVMTLLAE